MTRIDAIIGEIRKELEKRPALLDTAGLSALHLYMRFRGESRAPAGVVVKPEYKSRVEPRSRGGTS
jgi:hypothetical protein